MKRLLLINLILASCLTFGFGQQTKVVLDSSFYYYGDSPDTWELRQRNYFEYDDLGRAKEHKRMDYYVSYGWLTYKENYTYNVYDWNDTTFYFFWNQNENKWDLENRKVVVYNTKGLETAHLQTQLNLTTNDWDTIGFTKFEYDDADRLISQNDFYSKTTWEYNSAGFLVKHTKQDGWSLKFANEFEYDANNNLIKEYYQNYIISTPPSEFLHTYDNQNNRVTTTEVLYSNLSPTMYILDTFVYNAQNQHIERYTKLWDGNIWIPYNLRMLYSYNTNDLLLETVRQRRDSVSVPWQNYAKNKTVYNQNNEPTEQYKNIYWSESDQVWYGGSKETFDYDIYDQISEKVERNWVGSITGHRENKRKYTYFYNEKQITAIETLPIETACPFVNPYPNFTTIYCPQWEVDKTYQLQVFSIDGKLTYAKSFNGLDGLRVEKHLDRGWYVFVVLEDGKVLQKQKILVF